MLCQATIRNAHAEKSTLGVLDSTRAVQSNTAAQSGLLTTGLFLARSVHLSHIARKLPLQGQVVSLTNRLRRFLDDPRTSIWHYHQPVARQLLTSLWGQRLTLLIDCTALGFNYQLMGIAIAYHRRALPLIWSVHRGKHGMVHAQAHIVGQSCAFDFPQNGGLGCGRRRIWACSADALARQASLALLLVRENAYHYYRSGMGWAAVAAIPVTEGKTPYLDWVRWTKLENWGWVQLVAHWEQGEDEA